MKTFLMMIAVRKNSAPSATWLTHSRGYLGSNLRERFGMEGA